MSKPAYIKALVKLYGGEYDMCFHEIQKEYGGEHSNKPYPTLQAYWNVCKHPHWMASLIARLAGNSHGAERLRFLRMMVDIAAHRTGDNLAAQEVIVTVWKSTYGWASRDDVREAEIELHETAPFKLPNTPASQLAGCVLGDVNESAHNAELLAGFVPDNLILDIIRRHYPKVPMPCPEFIEFEILSLDAQTHSEPPDVALSRPAE